MSEPSYIRKIRVFNNRVDRDFEIDMTPTEGREFMHLILTGRNGSGKTSTLTLLNSELSGGFFRSRFMRFDGSEQAKDDPLRIAVEKKIAAGTLGLIVHLYPKALHNFAGDNNIVFFPARRSIQFNDVKGPTKDLLLDKPHDLEQYLVNLRTQVAYANEEGDHEAANRYQRQLLEYENIFQTLFEEPNLKLSFVREQISYKLSLGEKLVGFNALPDGFQSALLLWSAIYAATQRAKDDWGIVIIDELEAHLHLALQEKLLPFLTASFPRMQFIVATHSPVVISSIDGAVVYDLSTHTRELSDDLRGMEYGTLMTGHFGISSDFDIQSAKELRELKDLYEKAGRSPAEDARLRELAAKLSERSHALALKVWNELEFGAA